MMAIWRWLTGGTTRLGYVTPWNSVIAAKYADDTARYLLGWHGERQVVGNRIVEARELRVAARRRLERLRAARLAQLAKLPPARVLTMRSR